MKKSLDAAFWKGKKVFLTGHTGFKGSWLTLWLSSLGAELYGYSLVQDEAQEKRASMLAPFLKQETGDVAMPPPLPAPWRAPDRIWSSHLAAQALVRFSYKERLPPLKATSWEPPACWMPSERHRAYVARS